MEKIFEKIRAFLTLHDISAYGVAPGSALEGEPEGHRPSDLVPGAQSLFCAGVAVPKGIFQTNRRAETTYWRTASVIYRHLDAILVRCADMMEDCGELAVPVFGCFPYEVKGKGDFWGYLNLVKVGESSGVGKLGKNGLLINSKAGPRLILGGIVTTAKLPAMNSSESPQMGCPQGCSICREACPVNAIDDAGKVDRLKCIRHSIRSPLFSHLLKSGETDNADIEMVNQVCGVDDHSMYTCIACVAACPL